MVAMAGSRLIHTPNTAGVRTRSAVISAAYGSAGASTAKAADASAPDAVRCGSACGAPRGAATSAATVREIASPVSPGQRSPTWAVNRM
jgi:hypothetical protein